MCGMKAPKNFEKIAILKTQELVSFRGVKTDFGKIAQKWGIKKKDFNKYYDVAFDPNKIYTHLAPQNDCLNLSFVKDIYVVAIKLARNDQKMAIFETWIYIFFLTKLKNTVDKQSCNSCLSS